MEIFMNKNFILIVITLLHSLCYAMDTPQENTYYRMSAKILMDRGLPVPQHTRVRCDSNERLKMLQHNRTLKQQRPQQQPQLQPHQNHLQ